MPSVPEKSSRVSVPTELMWAVIGLVLTITGTWLEVFLPNPPWVWGEVGLHAVSLGVSFQVGAVLLTGCLAGKNSAALSQIAYLALGLIWFKTFGFQVFTQGGGLGYLREPTFGYLIGFVPGAWYCGVLAFRSKPTLETLASGCLAGLGWIHACGLAYLILAYILGWASGFGISFWQAVLVYSVFVIPGQLVVACAVSVIACVMRQVMFY
ncbi:MAG: biotin transporter BioY [Cyanobacteria bacterium J06639_16]